MQFKEIKDPWQVANAATETLERIVKNSEVWTKLTVALAKLELAQRTTGRDFNATLMNPDSYDIAPVTSYNGEMAAMTDAGVVIITKEQAKAFFNLTEA